MNLLFRSSARYFAGHPWQIALSILGVALGVAIVVAIDLANSSANAAFRRSAESVTGAATHHIVGGMSGFADTLYTKLRVSEGMMFSAPVVEGSVSVASKNSAKNQKSIFTVFGVDVFAEKKFRPYLQNTNDARQFDLAPLISRTNTILLSAKTAQNLALRVGDSLIVKCGGKSFPVKLCGLLTPTDDASEKALESMMVCDIGTAQHLLGMEGKLSRIDLIFSPSNESQEIQHLSALLPVGVEIIRSQARPKRIADMARAFDLNLTALSLLALMVGMFIIYNTMTFSVVQRQQFLGMVRVLGVTRREVFGLVMAETLCIGLCGTLGGLTLGIVLGQGLVGLVSQTINDLYFTVAVSGLEISPFVLAKGAIMGIVASVVSSLAPAREAMMSPPRTVLSRSAQEGNQKKSLVRYSLWGILLLVIGGLILLVPSKSMYVGYAGLVPILLGYSLFVPLFASVVVKVAGVFLQRTSGAVGAMAARGVIRSLSRTGVAIAALMVAVSSTIGVGIMVKSFRGTVVEWLTYTLSADIYISPPSLIARRNDNAIDSTLLRRITTHPDVQHFTTFRTFLAEMALPSIGQNSDSVRLAQIITTNYTSRTQTRFHFKKADQSTVWSAFQHGEAIVSEAFAFHNGVDMGSMIRLKTDKGTKTFRVAGVYYEYASDVGIVFIERSVYEQFWDNHSVSGVSIFLNNGVNHDAFIHAIQSLASGVQVLTVRSNRALLASSLEIFDRTFAITDVLRLLTVFVSFVGVLSALMALQLEKAREIGILRAIGFTPRQIWLLMTLQTGIIGAIAGILALPLGLTLAYILIFVINQRSFGWTLQFMPSPDILLQAFLLAVVAAILAGLYPAWKTSKTSPALALREE